MLCDNLLSISQRNFKRGLLVIRGYNLSQMFKMFHGISLGSHEPSKLFCDTDKICPVRLVGFRNETTLKQ